MADTEGCYCMFYFIGTLTKLKPMDGEFVLVVDGVSEGGAIISPEHFTGGEVMDGFVRARFGSLELEVHRISGVVQAA